MPLIHNLEDEYADFEVELHESGNSIVATIPKQVRQKLDIDKTDSVRLQIGQKSDEETNNDYMTEAELEAKFERAMERFEQKMSSKIEEAR